MMTNIFAYSGAAVTKWIRYTGQISLFFSQTIYLVFTPPFKIRRILEQALRVGPGTLFIASMVALFVGMIISLQMAYQMVQLSAELYIPKVISISLTRELAPVLTALIIAGRMGSGMTAEIGSMVVSEQVDALRAFAVNPMKYLVVPRFVAMVVMLPLLTVFADIIGILGGYFICVYKLSITPHMYFNMMADSLVYKDILTGLFKTVLFGAIIAIVGCYHGLNVRGGAEGVGRAATISVVQSFILIILVDCICTFLFYFVFSV